MYWLVLFGATLVCVHLYTRLLSRRAQSMLAHLPSYRTLPFIGNIYKFLGGGKNFHLYLNEIAKISENTKLPFVLWIPYQCLVVLTDPEDVRTAGYACLEKPKFYRFCRYLFGNGLLTAPGSIWKSNVKKFSIAFNAKAIDSYQPIFNEQSQKLIKNLQAEINGEPFNFKKKYLCYRTIQAISQTIFGVSSVSEESIFSKFYDGVEQFVQLVANRSKNILLHPEAIYRLTPAYRQIQRCVSDINSVTETILRERKLGMKEKRNGIKFEEIENDGDCEKTRFKPYLDLLLEIKEVDPTLTDQQIKDEVDTIFLAGQGTVATAINFVLLMLGSKLDIQRKLYDEIEQIFGDSKRPVLKEDLENLIYCDAVICETLRLYPPGPAALRYADRDVKLKSCTIPEGALCCLNLWGVGRSKSIWGPDALEFRPERWLEPTGAELRASAFVSFSSGRRACIGKRYAMNFMKTIIVDCLREFEFTSDADKMVLASKLLLHSTSGDLLQIVPRKRPC